MVLQKLRTYHFRIKKAPTKFEPIKPMDNVQQIENKKKITRHLPRPAISKIKLTGPKGNRKKPKKRKIKDEETMSAEKIRRKKLLVHFKEIDINKPTI